MAPTGRQDPSHLLERKIANSLGQRATFSRGKTGKNKKRNHGKNNLAFAFQRREKKCENFSESDRKICSRRFCRRHRANRTQNYGETLMADLFRTVADVFPARIRPRWTAPALIWRALSPRIWWQTAMEKKFLFLSLTLSVCRNL